MEHAAGAMTARLSEPLDESGLIRAAQAGDDAAFERLVRAYDHSVLRIAMNMLHSPEDARDVYQDAFLRVYRNLHSFRFDCNFHTWLYRIVTNLCLDHLRKRKVRREESGTVETGEGVVDRMAQVEEPAPHADPERQTQSRQLARHIESALSDLSPSGTDGFRIEALPGIAIEEHR